MSYRRKAKRKGGRGGRARGVGQLVALRAEGLVRSRGRATATVGRTRRPVHLN